MLHFSYCAAALRKPSLHYPAFPVFLQQWRGTLVAIVAKSTYTTAVTTKTPTLQLGGTACKGSRKICKGFVYKITPYIFSSKTYYFVIIYLA